MRIKNTENIQIIILGKKITFVLLGTRLHAYSRNILRRGLSYILLLIGNRAGDFQFLFHGTRKPVFAIFPH